MVGFFGLKVQDNVHVEVSWANKKDWIFSIFLFILSLGLVSVVYYYKPLIDHQLY